MSVCVDFDGDPLCRVGASALVAGDQLDPRRPLSNWDVAFDGENGRPALGGHLLWLVGCNLGCRVESLPSISAGTFPLCSMIQTSS